ncbi:hypothetical protein KQX54_001835 [Cotesia glomerata]|uniref:Uncharacterized protein n=1 Tax=Cotesia glomerata TaxID=32391 RepID=A0AAV7I8Z3_COTGL|nr:hypothetical protein KQX54_001835 [Cotesia glomerata]
MIREEECENSKNRDQSDAETSTRENSENSETTENESCARSSSSESEWAESSAAEFQETESRGKKLIHPFSKIFEKILNLSGAKALQLFVMEKQTGGHGTW